MKAYLGYARGVWEAFTSDTEPTEATHGDTFVLVWGPFCSLKAAKWIGPRTPGNPHFGTARQAERIYHDHRRRGES